MGQNEVPSNQNAEFFDNHLWKQSISQIYLQGDKSPWTGNL